MHRRKFVAFLCSAPVVGYAAAALARSSDELNTGVAPTGSLQSYAYYEPLDTDAPHDPNETDGTTYNMPCITAAEIAAAVDKTYDFWHGHGGTNHQFTVTTDHFKSLQQSQPVLVYTTMVEDHRHSLQISPTSPCEKSC